MSFINAIDFRSHRTQLVTTAVAASVATATAFSAYNVYSKRTRRRHLSDDVTRSLASKSNSFNFHKELDREPKQGVESKAGAFDETLIREQLARNYAFFGEDGMETLRKGRVAVIGCGGVGSWAAVMLVRSGVSHIRLVDFDYVTLSSLNRHATATVSDVGMPKVKSMEKALKQMARWVDIDAHVELWRKEEGGLLLDDVDWVIDAIDNISTKVDLLKYCHDNNIKVFSSMGAGAKCDPTRVQISDISYTIYDPLARSVRRRLRLQGVSSGIPVVYSTEVPSDVKLLPLPDEEFQKGSVKELGIFDDFRVRILPVLGPLPSIFGLHIATYILCELAGKPILNPLPIKNRRKVYDKLLRDLLQRESKLAGHELNKLPLDEDDVGFLFEDVYRGRSVLPPHDVPSRPVLVRWDLEAPLTLHNCVVMDQSDAEKHIKASREVWGEEAQEVVTRRAQEIARYQQWHLS